MRNTKHLLTFFAFLLLFFPSVVLAQGYNFWTQVYSVVFIIVFVLILLVLGGVISWPKMGSGSLGKFIGLLVFGVLIFVVPYIVYNYLDKYFPTYTKVPENFKLYPLPSYAAKALEALGLPSEWMYVPAIIYLFIIPFTGIYVVVWSFLQAIGIFSQKTVNRLLAFLITFLTIPVGWFVRLVWLLFAAMGIWSMIVFVAMFFAGVFFRGHRYVAKEYLEMKKLVDIRREKLKQLKNELEALKFADLHTLQSQLPSIQSRFADVMPVVVGSLLANASSASDINKARSFIDQAIKELKNQI